jgi:hypothetical protein
MSDRESDDQRCDKLLLRLLNTPPQPRPKRERSKGRVIEEDPVVIGVLPPPGFRWRILGKWPNGRTEVHFARNGSGSFSTETISSTPRTERKARRNSRMTSRVAETRQKSPS